MKKSIFFGLVLTLLCNANSSGKPILPLSFSPDDSLKIIEKVYLHVDRNSYFPGDDIWFKAYLIDASSRLLSDHSSNLHVELISPDMSIIRNRVVKLTAGLGNGDFHLPENLKSGRYRLRAYTNYMRNFGEELFFTRDILIINPSDAGRMTNDSISTKKSDLQLYFFPESGSLVNGVTSVVAFKAVDANEAGYNITGEIYSSTGDSITEFKSKHKGMGTFLLDPVPGLRYYAAVKNRIGNIISFEIPAGLSTGIVMNVNKNEHGELSLIFKTNQETLPLILDKDLSLTISAHNKAFKTYSIRIKSYNSVFNFPTVDIPDGIVSLTLSGVDKIPLCERLVFNKNDEDLAIRIETDKTEYNQRDSVAVKISLPPGMHIPQDEFLSLSATDNMFTDNSSTFSTTISSWFFLESDIRGVVEEPSYYFDPSNPERLKDLDLVLLTQGWRDFEWKYKYMLYPPEYGFTVSGRVRKNFADIPLKNCIVTIAIFGNEKPLICLVPTDSTGRFYLNRVDLTGSAKLLASVTDIKGNLKGWLNMDSARYVPAKIIERVSPTKHVQDKKELTSDNNISGENQLPGKNIHKYVQYVEFKESIRKKYKLSDTIPLNEIKVIARRVDEPESARARSIYYLMGTPDRELVVTPDLKVFNNVYDLVSTKFISPVKMDPKISFRMQNPIYMIDGMISTESDVRALPVSLVERIDVMDKIASSSIFLHEMRNESYHNNKPPEYAMADGVISIILRNDFTNNINFLHSVNITLSGFDEPRVFYSPKHSTILRSDYKPDLRTTLFWEPNITIRNNSDYILSYYNSDNSSNVKITVEGITSTGIPVTGFTEYQVK